MTDPRVTEAAKDIARRKGGVPADHTPEARRYIADPDEAITAMGARQPIAKPVAGKVV